MPKLCNSLPPHCHAVLCRGIPSPTSALAQPNRSLPPRRVLLRIPSPLPRFSCLATLRRRCPYLIRASPPLSNAKLIFPLPARCPAFHVFSRPVLCTPVLRPRHATLCHASALLRHAVPTPSNTTPSLCVALRCFAHAPQINPAPFRCSPLLCVPFAWLCIAMPALRQSLPSQSQSSPSPRFASHRPRVAGPSIAAAAPCHAKPPLSGAPPRLRSSVLIHALAPPSVAPHCRRFSGQSFA